MRWNKKDVGRTAVIQSNLNPKWDDESFVVKLPRNNNAAGSLLEIECWDMDRVGRGDFLGMITLEGSDLVNLFASEAFETEFSLGPSPALTAEENRLAVKGSLFVSGKIKAVKKSASETKKEEKVDPALKPFKIELRILNANNLSNASMFGRAPDSFASIYWPDPESKEIYKTQAIRQSNDPDFDNEVFVLEKREGLKLNECCLRMAMWNKNTVKSNDFLGEVILTGNALVEWTKNPNVSTFDLNKSPSLQDNQQNFVRGTIAIQGKVMKGGENEMKYQTSKKIPAGMKEMEISILACESLPKAKSFGSADPYCVIRWGNYDVGKTSTVKDSMDPVWENDESFVFRVPKYLGSPDLKPKKGDEFEQMCLQLIVDVYDSNMFGSGVFLGGFFACSQIGTFHIIDYRSLPFKVALSSVDKICMSSPLVGQ